MNSPVRWLCLIVFIAATAHAETPDTAKIEQIIGLKGALHTNEGVFQITVPRAEKGKAEDLAKAPKAALNTQSK